MIYQGAMPLLRNLAAAFLTPLTALHQAVRPGIRILMYHRVATQPVGDQLTVAPALFARQMEILARSCRVVSLDQAVAELGQERVRPAVAITFDDGYRDFLTQALPVLRRLGLPAAIFVTTRFSDQTAAHPRYPRTDDRLHLDWSELRELAASPDVTIGSHTLSHPFLPDLDHDASGREIAESRTLLQERLDLPVDFFCYPSGGHGPRELDHVAKAGYRAAVTVAPGLNRNCRRPFELTRTEITHKDGELAFRLKLAGGFDPLHALLRLVRSSP
jgi:peptidoglycan/xylan/chitin deacetylase (PgdA/CDA1 family)